MRAKRLTSRWPLVWSFCAAVVAAQIHIMDANGANVVQLTSSADPNWEPTVAIEGTRVAFNSERHSPHQGSEVYVINIDGTQETRITTTTTWHLEPSWPGR